MLLHYFHSTALSGHFGARKTLSKMTHFWWPQMRAEVFKFVRRCDLCQRAKPAQKTCVGLHSSTPCVQPMERLFIDFVEPLTRTKRGNVAILGSFSKFVSFFAVRKISAQVVCDCLEKAFFPAYGTPSTIVTDNARVFAANCSKIYVLSGEWPTSLPHLITPRPPWPNGSIVTSNPLLKFFTTSPKNAWDEDLPWLSVAFNTAVHESTGFTPDKIFLGRELKCPLLTRWNLSSVNNHDSGVANQSFWTQAYAKLQQARDKVARIFNVGRDPHQHLWVIQWYIARIWLVLRPRVYRPSFC